MTFYLGTHETSWLGRFDVPMFVSRPRLKRRKSLPRALGPWALDCGGFTVLEKYHEYPFTAEEYVADVRRYRDEIGNLEWAPCMDWMCEPFMLEKTGLPVWEHQQRTVASFIRLRQLAPEFPWVPVLQGFTRDDYMRCLEMYDFEWVDLTKEPLVGLGSVCRRQGTAEAEDIICKFHSMGIRLHGFGFKVDGLEKCAHMLASADSLAWSYNARRYPAMEGCTHKNCNSCPKWAMRWREGVLATIAKPKQWRLIV